MIFELWLEQISRQAAKGLPQLQDRGEFSRALGRATPRCAAPQPKTSCQRCPPVVPKGLSPAVDKRPYRFAQMWTRPGEIDVDKYPPLSGCPRPVDGCGWAVEGSGENGPAAFRRYPQGRGQVRWTTGGLPVDNGGQPRHGRQLWTQTAGCTRVSHMPTTGG